MENPQQRLLTSAHLPDNFHNHPLAADLAEVDLVDPPAASSFTVAISSVWSTIVTSRGAQ